MIKRSLVFVLALVISVLTAIPAFANDSSGFADEFVIVDSEKTFSITRGSTTEESWGWGYLKSTNALGKKPQGYALTRTNNGLAFTLRAKVICTDDNGDTYTLVYNKKNELCVQDVKQVEAKILPQNNYSGILLNTDFTSIDKNMLPNLQLRVHAGEDIKLACRLGNYSDCKDFLILFTINWNQTTVNGNKYQFIEVPKSALGLIEMEFKAPLSKGSYDVAAWLVSEPFSQDTDFFPLESSYRFSLIVE